MQELLKGLGNTNCRACIEDEHTKKYYTKNESLFQVCAKEPGRGVHFGVLDGLLSQTNQNDHSISPLAKMLSKHTHQRLFMKKNKNHLEGKVLPADLEHACMYNKINIFEAENLGYVSKI